MHHPLLVWARIRFSATIIASILWHKQDKLLLKFIQYTDGSKEDSRVGAGWLCSHGDTIIAEDCIPLGPCNTVFQAEVMAITEALSWIKENLDPGTAVSVRSDSSAAIQAITVLSGKDGTSFM